MDDEASREAVRIANALYTIIIRLLAKYGKAVTRGAT
jgi:hypothetical protein